MCIMRSPPHAYSITKHTCSGDWKQANRLTRNGCMRSELFVFECPTDLFPVLLDLSKRLALLEGESHYLVQLQLLLSGSETPSELHPETRIVRFEYFSELREKLDRVQRLSALKNAIIKKHALWLNERWSRLDVALVHTLLLLLDTFAH